MITQCTKENQKKVLADQHQLQRSNKLGHEYICKIMEGKDCLKFKNKIFGQILLFVIGVGQPTSVTISTMSSY